MIKMMEPMAKELKQEAETTRRMLERVPPEKLSWKPHAKSMSLGQLTLHIASIPGGITKIAKLDAFDAANAKFNPPEPTDAKEILATLDASVKSAEEYLGELSETAAAGSWRLKVNGREVSTTVRAEMLRSLLLNDWYHHRGQLSVYLRMLEVRVPAIYGPSADESPFA